MAQESFQLHRNSFEKGLNADFDPNVLDASQYTDATNVSLVADNKFLALQNITGTTNVKAITGTANTDVLGVFATKYTIGATLNVNCLTIFTAVTGGNINIWCYDIDHNNLYTLYQVATPADYFTSGDRVIDGVVYPEMGLDIIYFTDNYNEIRKIRCNIQAPHIAPNSPFLTDTIMGVARRQAVGDIQFVATSDGGTLLTGTYQLAYQLIDTNTNKYTRFSLLSTPIHVYAQPFSTDLSIRSAGVGLKSNQKISVNILPTQDELTNYSHFRFAIVENVGPEGAIPLTAYVTEIQPIATYLIGNVITNYQITANYQTHTVTVDEIVIDTAAIAHVKSINIKNNRLFSGDLTYTTNLYNNGTPTVTGGSVLKQVDSGIYQDSFRNPDMATKYKGYFRGEVYRYAISYFDKYGNYSSPSVLNLASLPENQGIDTNNAFTNPTFTASLAGWSQVGPGVLWVFGAGNAQYASAGTDNSQIIYQAVNPIQGQTYIFSATVDAGVLPGVNTFQLIGLIGVGAVSSTNLTRDPATGIMTTTFTVPIGTPLTGIGFKWTVVGGGVGTKNLISMSWTKPIVDFKFPRRNQKIGSTTYTLFDSVSGYTQSLGLQLTGIDHHPTWAKGFIIVRAPRKKDVLFQTPLVPMCNIYGIGPIDNYPSIAREGSTPANVIYTSGTSAAGATGIQATPMGPDVVLYPMTLGWPKKRSIVKVETDNTVGGGGNKAARVGEAQLVNDPPLTNAQIFSQGNLYTQNHPYVWAPAHQLDTIDSALLTFRYDGPFNTLSNGGTSWNAGSGTTSASFSFFAVADNQYYYNSGHSGAKAALRSSTNPVAGYAPFQTGSPGTILNGKFVFTLDKLATGGAVFGFMPYVQKSGVIELQNVVTSIDDTSALVYAAGSSDAKVTEPFTDLTTTSSFINSMEIVNVIAGQTDTRYGTELAFNNYIYTGTKVVFTDSEVTTNIQTGTSLPKTVDIWGGDCFVSNFGFKLTDTIYSVTNQEKYVVAKTGQTDTQIVLKWGRSYVNAAAAPAQIAMPVALTNCSQYLNLILESEFNGSAVDMDTAKLAPTDGALNFHIYVASTNEAKCRSPLVYGYNYGVNKENDQRIFVPVDPLTPVLTTLKARIAYSNEKVYNTSTDGFDTILVLNFYDLPETYGSLTKLAIAGNDLYTIQQSGISYLPIENRVIETSDASNLQVRSGDIINIPVWIDIKRGGQHLRGIKETGTTIYILDNANEAIYNLSGQELKHISDKGLMSISRNLFSTTLSEQNIITVHDILRNELWLASKDGSFCYVWNENYGCWVSRYTWSAGNLMGGVFTTNKLYLTGRGVDNNNLSVHTMYTGNAGQLMGTYVTPSVSFIVNPQPEFGKTFDDILINSTDRLAQITSTVTREAALGNQVATVLSLNVNTRGEGNYRAKILRAANGARLRGGKASHILNWNSGGGFLTPVTVQSVLTQWRPSFKQF